MKFGQLLVQISVVASRNNICERVQCQQSLKMLKICFVNILVAYQSSLV